jgi:hypothetical protein
MVIGSQPLVRDRRYSDQRLWMPGYGHKFHFDSIRRIPRGLAATADSPKATVPARRPVRA